MEFFHLITQNIFSPAILFFALGIIAGFVKSNLEVPDSISRYLSIYLMMAIGLKGGVAIANTDEFTPQILGAIASGVAFSFLIPFLSYGILRFTTKLDKPTAAAVAAHYGSISLELFKKLQCCWRTYCLKVSCNFTSEFNSRGAAITVFI